jgi:hypothetical protein
MAQVSGSDPTLGTGSSIGRYFSIVSVVPSVLFTAWSYLLISSGAWTDGPTVKHLVENNPIAQPAYAAAALAAAFGIAVICHPIQFALVQLLEGYWPNTAVMRRLRTSMVMGHLQHLHRADRRMRAAEARRDSLPTPDSGDLNQFLAPKRLAENVSAAREVVNTQTDLDAWVVAETSYPTDLKAILPTMLGNTLRKHELAAGAAVHLPIFKWATHIGMVADPAHTSYINDQRTQLDLAARVTASAYLASALTFAALWPTGWPVVVALIPYAAGILAYRGAVIAADSYGAALCAWVDLNRSRLYEQLGLPAPADTDAEREQNDALEDLRLGHDSYAARLRS